MDGISFLCFCYICVIGSAAFDFSDHLNDGVYCQSSHSNIVMQDDDRSWIVTKCDEPLPLKPTVNAKQITQFTLQYNNMNRLTQKQFHGLSSVKQLRFYENNVQLMHKNALERLKSLTILTIIEPQLAIGVLHLSRECKLENLNLRLKMIDSELLSKLPKDITNITIEDTPVVNGEIFIPDHLVNLKYLRFKNCSIATIKGPNVTLSALEYLDLSHNKIEEKTWTWHKYPNLMTLTLSYNRITSIDEKDFKDLKSLRMLQLDNNNIGHVSFNAFETNLNLTIVDLSNNNLMRIQLNYTEFHNYHVQAACNQMSLIVLPKAPFLFNTTNHIECKNKHQNSPIMSYIRLFALIYFIIINLVILIRSIMKWRKRKLKRTTLNETENYDDPNETQSLYDEPQPLSAIPSVESIHSSGDSGVGIDHTVTDESISLNETE